MFVFINKKAVRKNFKLLILCGLIFYFAYHLISGRRGILTLGHLDEKVLIQEQSLATLQIEHDQLAHRVAMLRPGSISKDMLEQRIKEVLGYANKNEILIIAEK